MEKGLFQDKEQEFLIAGKMTFDKYQKKIVMKAPKLLIATDRLEFYEYLGRRRETLGLHNQNWIKLCVGLTAMHFLIVRVPTIFSKHFGDEVGVINKKLGSEDQSDILFKMA